MAKRKDKLPQFVPLLHKSMDTPAWLALTPYAKALYPLLKRRAGYGGKNNGSVTCSVREAADYLNVSVATGSRALKELQRKGFLVAVRVGCLGVAGEGKATTWWLTELGSPGNPRPTDDYLSWSEGNDFPVAEGKRRAA